jgi:asparaginyl-tRNA synthetase
VKDSYVVDLAKLPLGTAITLFGWIQSKRTHGKLIFIDVIDSTGEMQAVIDSSSVEPGVFILASGISCESSVKIQGFLENNNRDNHREIRVTDIEISPFA